MPVPVIAIELEMDPAMRWGPLKPYAKAAQALVDTYIRDLGLEGEGLEVLESVHLASEFRDELLGMSQALNIDYKDLLTANLYYDAIKTVIGCTAFAVETDDGPLHARNLDWWGEDDILKRHTAIFDFRRDHRTVFQVVGWPGFAGAFSGIAPGRFAVTLNAVSSNEPACPGSSVTFLLRRTLEMARNFDDALNILQQTVIPCDCLLLLTGVRAGQRVVIERTPTTCALRYPQNDMLVVANSYEVLEQNQNDTSLLSQTSCCRTARVRALLGSNKPQTANECLQILADPQVEMSITAQSMVFQAFTGLREVRCRPRSLPQASAREV